MPLKQWLRKLTGGDRDVTTTIAEQGQFYYLLNYDEHYPELVASLPREATLSELFLFRFWLTQYAYRVSRPAGVSEDEILECIVPNGLTLGRGIFEKAHSVDLENSLADCASTLMDERFSSYDFAVSVGKSPTDRFGLTFASIQLGKRLVEKPFTELNAYLSDKAHEQFRAIVALNAGGKESAERITDCIREVSKWQVVNEFGDCKTLIDLASIEIDGRLLCVKALYDLKPSGVDKRNNKPVRQMLMLEEYDLETEQFRVFRIEFVYEDGSPNSILSTEPVWKPATAGHAKTLQALKKLAIQ